MKHVLEHTETLWSVLVSSESKAIDSSENGQHCKTPWEYREDLRFHGQPGKV